MSAMVLTVVRYDTWAPESLFHPHADTTSFLVYNTLYDKAILRTTNFLPKNISEKGWINTLWFEVSSIILTLHLASDRNLSTYHRYWNGDCTQRPFCFATIGRHFGVNRWCSEIHKKEQRACAWIVKCHFPSEMYLSTQDIGRHPLRNS